MENTRSLLKHFTLFTFLFVLVTPAFAKRVEVKIPGEGWKIRFESPPLSNIEDSSEPGGYSFRGNSGRFNVSLFVETPASAGKSHQDCYRFYWPQASRNPLIAVDTVKKSETSKFVSVQYDIVSEFRGKPIRSANINIYFVFRGKWVDVHVSIIEPTAADLAILDEFGKSLDYR